MAKGQGGGGGGVKDPTIYGTIGNDVLNIGDAEGHGVIVDGLAGNDTITGSSFDDFLFGNVGNDRIFGVGGNDYITGGQGNDYMDGGIGADTVYYSDAISGVTVDLSLTTAQNTGGSGLDTVINFEIIGGSDFNDTLLGNAFRNNIYGMSGNDQIDGRGGSDSIDGGDGNDILRGGDGNDIIRPDYSFGIGNDFIDGGSGVDAISYYADSTTGITLNLTLLTAQNTVGAGIDTVLNVENIEGTIFADKIIGSAAANIINGNGGNDVINGLGGNDVIQGSGRLDGGAGADILYAGAIMNGGAGNDQLHGNLQQNRFTGGSGTDIFIFDSQVNESVPDFFDTITDFSRVESDKIDVHSILPGATFIGNSAYTSFLGQPEIRVSSGSGFQIVEADVTGDRISDFYLKVTGSTPLLESDFIL